MQTPLILIVGAGPTGMTMAIELRRFGLEVRIIDKSDHPALHSQALVVQARTLEQLQRYGIAAAAVASGRRLTRGEFFSEGKRILSIDLHNIPSRYPYALFLPQSETEAILNRHMESLGVRIERETELLGFKQTGLLAGSPEAGVSASLRHADGSQEHVQPRWIIGCDGAHSVVRQHAGIDFEGGGTSLSFFLGDFEIEGPDAPGDALSIHFYHGNVVVMGQLSDKFTRVIVALHSEQKNDTKRDLTFQDFQGPIDEAGIRVKILSSDWMTPFRVNDRQASLYRKGSVFLAGDASHIHSPVGGQGMNTGMQDAANLAWKLSAVAHGADDRLLDSYQEERAAVGKALLSFTGRGLKLATTANPLLEKLRDILLPHIVSLHSVQKAMLGFISETAIEYRSSSIVSDHGGDGFLRAGDRLPDIHIGEQDKGSTLLESWTEPEHLAILLNATDEEATNMAAGFAGIPIYSLHGSDLDDEGRNLMGGEKKLFILRPDGYVGFRAPLAKRDELRAYVSKVGMVHPSFDHK